MVSNEGRLKVLDFGLAKDVRGSNLGDATMTSASRTEVGVVMGTLAYMSPEQTSGRALDHRTADAVAWLKENSVPSDRYVLLHFLPLLDLDTTPAQASPASSDRRVRLQSRRRRRRRSP